MNNKKIEIISIWPELIFIQDIQLFVRSLNLYKLFFQDFDEIAA